ncbi:phasin [Cohaesibacter sp. ES.047]|uniref:phasin family protein n=1 Tax=Cohaesibacter sp. ES.047 TaxID=1798205 RepID=UPI000BC077CD|nr:phasin family protein [Cohaesibacter sp. ES.047]SNY91962.1 phasin [Cohaesibacter sp. ES.047]
MTATTKKTPARRTPSKAAASPAPAKKQAPVKAGTEPATGIAAATEAPKETTKEEKAAPKASPEASEVAASLAFTTLDFSQFDLSQSALPDVAREAAEKSIASARDGFERSRTAFEDQKAALEESYDSAASSAKLLNKKAIDATRDNMNAGFSFMVDLLGAKTLSDAIELQTSFASKQLETLTAQSKDFQESIGKSLEDINAPLKAATDKTMEKAKAL